MRPSTRSPKTPVSESVRSTGTSHARSLIEAAYRNELAVVCDAAPDLLASLPPEEATRAWMDRFIDYMTTKFGMAEALRA